MAEAKILVVTPFTVEIDHPRNCDVMIQSIPGCKLRSAVDGNKGVKNQYGDTVVPVDQARSLSGFPRTPGMRLHVDPEDLTYDITDPMYNNIDLCRRVRNFLIENSPYRPEIINGVEPLSGTLDKHRIKSLCRELFHIIKNEWAEVVEGPEPMLEDIDDLPGNYLLNPGARVQNTQPMYEKDWESWVENLGSRGG